MSEIGNSKWGDISRALKSHPERFQRSGKQCRERWHNHLDPEIKKKSWTETEKSFILQLHEVYGNHWSQIAKHLPGRSDNAVKNFFYSNWRKSLRHGQKKLKKTKLSKNRQLDKSEDQSIKVDVLEESNADLEASEILLSLSKSSGKISHGKLELQKGLNSNISLKDTSNKIEYKAEYSNFIIPEVFYHCSMNSSQFIEYPVSFISINNKF